MRRMVMRDGVVRPLGQHGGNSIMDSGWFQTLRPRPGLGSAWEFAGAPVPRRLRIRDKASPPGASRPRAPRRRLPAPRTARYDPGTGSPRADGPAGCNTRPDDAGGRSWRASTRYTI